MVGRGDERCRRRGYGGDRFPFAHLLRKRRNRLRAQQRQRRRRRGSGRGHPTRKALFHAKNLSET